MSAQKNILYLSYDGLTDPLGQSQILPYVIGLSKYGYRFTIISAEKKENFEKRKKVIEAIVRENNIFWEPVFYTKKPPVFSTLWDINQMQQKALLLHKQRNFHIVHCRSYITALIGLALKKKADIPFIFDMRGFWADERVEGGLWNMKNPVFKNIYTYFKRKEKAFLQQAAYTISLTHQAKEEIHSWQGFSQIPIQVIPCCVDTELFVPEITGKQLAASNQQLAANGSDLHSSGAGFTISYLGSLGTWYLLEEMLLFFKRLLLQKPEAVFLFITPDNPHIILQQAEVLGIPASKFSIRKAERREVPLLLAQSDVSIFFIKPCYSKKASSPTKMGEILSIGVPIICNSGVGDTDYLFEKYNPGLLLKELNQENYDNAVIHIDKLSKIPAKQLRHAALTYFDLQKGVDLYKEVYQKLMTKKHEIYFQDN